MLVLAACGDGGRAATTTTATTATTDAVGVDGADGLGDPYFPELGGAGYDVERYELDLDVTGDGRHLDGTATITATAEVDLASFALDLVGLEVHGATVDGEPADVDHDGRELRITPDGVLPAGETFTAVVDYGGEPKPVDAAALGAVGWRTDEDGSYVVGEPHGAATWFPANDHPSDKARFAFSVTVPAGVEAVATGVLRDRQDDPERSTTTWRWEMDDPMATYLAGVAVGQYTLSTEAGPAGVTIRNAFADAVADEVAPRFSRQDEMLAFFADRFGPYPFDAYGALVVDEPLNLALETQSLSLFGTALHDEAVVAHELAHQWFGDSVTPATWSDVWLNEGLATWAQWLWEEHAGGPSVADRAREVHASLGEETVPPGDPGPERLFDPAVYGRGALAVHALEVTLGRDGLLEVLRAWLDEHAGGNGTIEQFLALAEEVSGTDVEALLDPWLFASEVPPLPG